MTKSFISKKCDIGQNVIIGANSFIYGNTTIGNNSIIENNVIIGHPSFDEIKKTKINYSTLQSLYENTSTGLVKIGANSIIRSNTVIYDGCLIGDNFDCGHNTIIRENCKIGNNVYLFVNTELKRSVTIGDECRLAGTVCDRTVIGSFSSVYGHTVHKYSVGVGGYTEIAPTIGNCVIVGREAVIVGNVNVEDFCLISSNSVLLESTIQYGLYAGNPAKLVRLRTADEYYILFNLMNKKNEKT